MSTRYLLLLLTDAGVPCAWLSAPSVNTLCAWLPRRWSGPLVGQLITAMQDLARVPSATGRQYLGYLGERHAFLLGEALAQEEG